MENNEFTSNYNCMNPLNNFNKNLSPVKEYSNYRQSAFITRENFPGVQNGPFFNNPLSCYNTPKKDFNSVDPDNILSPIPSTLRKSSLNNLNEMTPFKPMLISPYNSSRMMEKT